MLAGLLPPSVVTVEATEDIDGEQPFPGEARFIAQAVESRRREFITARRCARQALAQLGHSATEIMPGPNREPLWLDGVVGSITHCIGYRAAVVAHRSDLDGLGIDAEPHAALPDGVEEQVAVVAERDHLAHLAADFPQIYWDRLLFSAKEAIYKAWYPLTENWLGFKDANLTFDPSASAFRAQIQADGRRADSGPPLTVLTGRFLVRHGLLVTAVCIEK